MKEPKISLEKAPFDSAGNLMHYPESWREIEWRPNEPFHATLRVDDMRSGRSAKYLILRHPNSNDEREYPMFVTDLISMLAQTTVTWGVVSGRWRVRKRGQNYGLVFIGNA